MSKNPFSFGQRVMVPGRSSSRIITQYKLMPKAAFELSVFGGHKHSTWSLKEAGIATVTEI